MSIKRIYLDYNATSPLSRNAIAFLECGDFYFSNPSSQHSSGKKINQEIKKSRSFFLDFFNLSSEFHIIFHSGATEAMNSIFRGLKKGDSFAFFESDHSLVFSIANYLEELGVEVIKLPVEKSGAIDWSLVCNMISNRTSLGQCWLNVTWMNNETGVVCNLDEVAKVKAKLDIFVHVDAVQTPGKIENFRELNCELDAYTYSGHKFGALKGCGLSFIKNPNLYKPLILGGGQQSNIRSGTVNSYGIFSMEMALRDISLDTMLAIKQMKIKLEETFNENPNLFCVANESMNTIVLIHKYKKADNLFIHFDMHGLDVSMGSACSSGSFVKSHVLEAMGLKEYAANGIRISLGKESLKEDLLSRIEKVVQQL